MDERCAPAAPSKRARPRAVLPRIPGALALASAFLFVLPPARTRAEEAGAGVTREEVDALKAEVRELTRQLQHVQQQSTPQPQVTPSKTAAAKVPAASRAATTNQSAAASATQGAAAAPASPASSGSESAVTALGRQVQALESAVEEARLGSTRFLLTGNASAGFTAPQHGASNFGATLSPLLLWKLSDNLFVESEVEFELEGSDTSTKLEFAQIAWSPLDFLTIGAGKFLSPSNVFVERYEPKWINKFPDTPLAVYDGLLPESHVGAQARGGLPIGPSRINYALYVGNGARLQTGSAEEAGTLGFDNFTDTNRNKSVGGRVGFLPYGQMLELGYAFETGKAGDPDGVVPDAGYLLQSADFDFSFDSALLRGRLGARGQYAWSTVDRRTYDADASLGFGPLDFSNNRDGGYAQLSYRPTHSGSDWLSSTEFLARYDRLNNPSGLSALSDQQRYTLGLDYWLGSSTVLKLAYEFDQEQGTQDNNAVLLQLATGF